MSRRAVRPFRARLERPEVTKTGEFSNVISGENCSATHSVVQDTLTTTRSPGTGNGSACTEPRSAGHGCTRSGDGVTRTHDLGSVPALRWAIHPESPRLSSASKSKVRVMTQGRSRIRKLCTYGSERGRRETSVPTATDPPEDHIGHPDDAERSASGSRPTQSRR